jgi:SH3-like domain-containing protein
VHQASAVVAVAYNGNWLRVQAEDGRSGWIYQTLLDLS